jgi:hypothetical protein
MLYIFKFKEKAKPGHKVSEWKKHFAFIPIIFWEDDGIIFIWWQFIEKRTSWEVTSNELFPIVSLEYQLNDKILKKETLTSLLNNGHFGWW